MSNLEDIVRSVVNELIDDGALFTALDVSNRVKDSLPTAKHREVRDVVRSLFSTEIEVKGYERTPITVWLDNGDQATALLYHPLADAWDLDAKYDQQQRGQTSSRPLAAAQAAVQAAQKVIPVKTPATVSTAAPPVVSPMTTARQQWDQLFATQPSLFPKR